MPCPATGKQRTSSQVVAGTSAPELSRQEGPCASAHVPAHARCIPRTAIPWSQATPVIAAARAPPAATLTAANTSRHRPDRGMPAPRRTMPQWPSMPLALIVPTIPPWPTPDGDRNVGSGSRRQGGQHVPRRGRPHHLDLAVLAAQIAVARARPIATLCSLTCVQTVVRSGLSQAQRYQDVAST